MARPIKHGLDYFPVSVNIFDDEDLKDGDLMFGDDDGRFVGRPVTMLYVFLLCRIFDKSYYMELNDLRLRRIAQEVGEPLGKVRQIISFLCSRSLLVKIEGSGTLATGDTVITSAGIQRQFQECVKGRGAKRAVEVREDFWLLEERETETFIKVLSSGSKSGKNKGFSEKNPDKSEKNSTNKNKEKEKKEKENKENISMRPAAQYLPDKEANDCLSRYLTMRERDGGKLSQEQINVLVEKLISITDDPAKQRVIISEAIIHNWKSFYPLDTRGSSKGGGKMPSGSFYHFEQRQYGADLDDMLVGMTAAASGGNEPDAMREGVG